MCIKERERERERYNSSAIDTCYNDSFISRLAIVTFQLSTYTAEKFSLETLLKSLGNQINIVLVSFYSLNFLIWVRKHWNWKARNGQLGIIIRKIFTCVSEWILIWLGNVVFFCEKIKLDFFLENCHLKYVASQK